QHICIFFFQAEDGIRDRNVTGVQTCALPIYAIVDGKVKLGGAKESSAKALMQLGNRHRISLFINDRDYGETKPYSVAAGHAELKIGRASCRGRGETSGAEVDA